MDKLCKREALEGETTFALLRPLRTQTTHGCLYHYKKVEYAEFLSGLFETKR
jgi:hypothetical protein